MDELTTPDTLSALNIAVCTLASKPTNTPVPALVAHLTSELGILSTLRERLGSDPIKALDDAAPMKPYSVGQTVRINGEMKEIEKVYDAEPAYGLKGGGIALHSQCEPMTPESAASARVVESAVTYAARARGLSLSAQQIGSLTTKALTGEDVGTLLSAIQAEVTPDRALEALTPQSQNRTVDLMSERARRAQALSGSFAALGK